MRAYHDSTTGIKALILEARDGYITIAQMLQWIDQKIVRVKVISPRKERTGIYVYGPEMYDVIYYGDLIINVTGRVYIVRGGDNA